MSSNKIFGFNLVKAVLISLIFSCVSILIFALVLYLFSIPNEAIKPVNCLIKVMATFIGCFFSIKGEKGFIKGLVYVIIMLTLIHYILAPGWAEIVIPIVCFGGIVLSAILFFTDFERQKHNLLPMLLLTFASLIASVVFLSAFEETRNWEMIVMCAVSSTLLIVLAITLGSEFIKELKRRFHI